tara:strand:- start:4489 stop:4713 length:225 start_codon:yes stop_codon:yes gene_type:complete
MKHKTKENFLITYPEHNILYQSLLKEARMWNNSGQYWLGKEAEKKAAGLLNGQLEQAMTITKTEQFFFKTNRIH